MVSLYHQEWSLPNPMLNNFALKHTMRIIIHSLGDTMVRKYPDTPELLHKIQVHLDISVFRWNYLGSDVTMFFGLLSKNNIIPTVFKKYKYPKRRNFLSLLEVLCSTLDGRM